MPAVHQRYGQRDRRTEDTTATPRIALHVSRGKRNRMMKRSEYDSCKMLVRFRMGNRYGSCRQKCCENSLCYCRRIRKLLPCITDAKFMVNTRSCTLLSFRVDIVTSLTSSNDQRDEQQFLRRDARSAKRGMAIVNRPSICPSVCDGSIDWVSSKLIH